MPRHAKLEIAITFIDDLTYAQQQEAERVLRFAANHLASNGLLSGESEDLLVEDWDEKVTIY